jgi:hypothetical protein
MMISGSAAVENNLQEKAELVFVEVFKASNQLSVEMLGSSCCSF